MKSIVSEPLGNSKPFPKLMRARSSGNIWLVTSFKKGMIVALDDSKEFPYFHIGYMSDGLEPTSMVDYNGTVTLSNE